VKKQIDHTAVFKRNTATVGDEQISIGDELRIFGLRGTFVFLYQWIYDDSLACWDSKRHRMRAFRCNQVQSIKKPTNPRGK
jgi:hypothetical protein